jgi:DNA-damage-inducible protein D
MKYWFASDLMVMLGYSDMKQFHRVLDRTTKALVSLGIPHYENIFPFTREEDGKIDFKLTRFACYLTAMNANPKLPQVAAMQAYFVMQTRKFELFIKNSQEVERISIREELTEGYKSLASTASEHGVINYGKFQNAGYLGMYNKMAGDLEQMRGVEKGHLSDYMGRTELAANLFRVTQTEERIKNKNVKGQQALEITHYEVGREVRDIIQKNMGISPEDMPQAKVLPEVKKELKSGYQKMLQADATYTSPEDEENLFE